MGSYALSQNTSNTAYTNAPIAQENVSNPINLSNSAGVRLGSNDIKTDLKVGGAYSNTVLDGGAINSAFAFGGDVVKVLADLTKSNNQGLQASNAAALGLAGTNNAYLDKYANKDANSDWTQNKTLLYVVGAVAIFYVFKVMK